MNKRELLLKAKQDILNNENNFNPEIEQNESNENDSLLKDNEVLYTGEVKIDVDWEKTIKEHENEDIPEDQKYEASALKSLFMKILKKK